MSDISIIILIPLLSFFLTVLDTSFFSFYEIFNSTVISTFAVLLVLSLFGYRRIAIYFAAFCVLFLATFSSLPLTVMFLGYFGIPFFIFYIRTKLFFESNLGPAIAIFVSSNLLFRLFLLTLDSNISRELITSIISFPIINSLFCIIIFVITKRWFLNKKYID